MKCHVANTSHLCVNTLHLHDAFCPNRGGYIAGVGDVVQSFVGFTYLVEVGEEHVASKLDPPSLGVLETEYPKTTRQRCIIIEPL